MTKLFQRRKQADAPAVDAAPDAKRDSVFGTDPFSVLRRRWGIVPAGDGRVATGRLLKLSDAKLLETWRSLRDEATTGAAFGVRGWYHLLYKDVLKNRVVADVGSGMGIDGITFAQAGARVIFVDIVEENLALLRRLCRLHGVTDADFLHLADIASLRLLPREVDVFWSQGSLINAPFDLAREESRAMLEHLPVGGRWIELVYPKARWERDGRLPFHLWGERTDGPGTPWVEWYDRERLLRRLRPATFEVVLDIEFHDGQLAWFDLLRIG